MDIEKGNLTIPYFCHEGDMARAERTIKRLWILCILLIILLVGSYAAFFYYESQYEDIVTTTQEVTQDSENGTNNFIGGDGVIADGESGRYSMPHYGYGNSYNYGGSYRRGRDSMGRYTSRRGGYSYDDGMIEELRSLMENAPDERTKSEFRQFIAKMEKM